MPQPVPLPEGLAELPPGPRLCALLADLDPARVSNHATVDLLRAWRRLRSFTEAGELAVMAEVGRCDLDAAPDTITRLDRPAPDAYVEIAAALTLTDNAAAHEHSLAQTLVHQLPTVHAALAAGRIDRAKAWVFADHLGDSGLTDAQITRILAALLPRAPGLTTGQLRHRLQRMIIAIDPDAARRRYQAALRERRVICYLDDDGTATLSASGLEPAAAQAACERIDTLARQVREAGHPDALPRIRADVYTALLDGSLHTMTNDQIVATMLARATQADSNQDDSHAATQADAQADGNQHDTADPGNGVGDRHNATDHHDGNNTNNSDDGSGNDGGNDGGDGDGDDHGVGDSAGREQGAGGETDTDADREADNRHDTTGTDDSDTGTGTGGTETSDTETDSTETDSTETGSSGTGSSGTGSSGTGSSGTGSSGTGGTESDGTESDGTESDGTESGGTGAEEGESGAANTGDTGTDAETGEAAADGTVTGGAGNDEHRPTPTPTPTPPERARPGIEIRVRLSTLIGLDDHPAEIAGLGPILAHTARDAVARHRHAHWRFAITDPDGHLLLAGGTRHRPHPLGDRSPRPHVGGTVELQIPATLLAELAADPPPGWEALLADLTAQYAHRDRLRAALDNQPHARFPHPALRRHVEVRDRTCRFPGCRRPTRKTQQDHTLDHQHGGRSVTDNLGALCVFHHALKTTGRWWLYQPQPGTFSWLSPLGHGYLTRGEPVCPPLPDSLPSPADPPGTDPDPGTDPAAIPAAQRELDEQPLFPEPAPELMATPTDDDAPDRAPPPDLDDDEPPF